MSWGWQKSDTTACAGWEILNFLTLTTNPEYPQPGSPDVPRYRIDRKHTPFKLILSDTVRSRPNKFGDDEYAPGSSELGYQRERYRYAIQNTPNNTHVNQSQHRVYTPNQRMYIPQGTLLTQECALSTNENNSRHTSDLVSSFSMMTTILNPINNTLVKKTSLYISSCYTPVTTASGPLRKVDD